MEKSSLEKKKVALFDPQQASDKEVHSFPKGISPKEKVIAQMVYELIYYKVTEQHINLFASVTPPLKKEMASLSLAAQGNAIEPDMQDTAGEAGTSS